VINPPAALAKALRDDQERLTTRRPGMRAHTPRRCDQTGLTIPECSCPACWASMQAREDVRRVIETGHHSMGYVIDAGLR
jgi:hypothetical protein